MGHRVDAAEGGERLGQVHHQVGVDDGHVRRQFVVGDGILLAGRVVGDHGERRHFGAGARGGGDGDQLGLDAHLGELVDALADVHEAQGQVLEIHLRVLVHHPGDLGGVHGRAAAQGHDHIGLEGVQHVDALAHRGQVGVGLHLREDVHLQPQLLEMRRSGRPRGRCGTGSRR